MREKRYTGLNVLEAAKVRIRHVIDTHDSLAVCFSGGKDSLVVLHLTLEVLAEYGVTVLDVVFRDEEIIPNCVIDFVNLYRARPDIRMLYLAVPLKSNKFVLGQSVAYVQWDAARPHVRPMPAHAVRQPPDDKTVYDQYTLDDFAASHYRGKVALLTGVRCAESLMRLRSVLSKGHEPHISQSRSRKSSICKPIYDWQEDDVFRYLWERSIPFCPIYDRLMFSETALRVSTPLHSESAKHIDKLREYDPEFYDRILTVFPEMRLQDRYFKDLNKTAVAEEYAQDMEGVLRYVHDHIDESRKALALERFAQCVRLRIEGPDAYPVRHVLKYFMGGSFKRWILPMEKSEQGRP